MHRSLLLLGAAAVGLPLVLAGALAADDGVVNASKYIHSNLEADGSYGSTSPGQNMDAILAIRSAGYDPAKDRLTGGLSPTDYLEANAGAAEGAGGAAKAALAAKALGLDPSDVGGTDLIEAVESQFDSSTGRFGADDFTQSIAILGLACTGSGVDPKAAEALEATQTDDGGWGFGGSSDPDTTAIALQALLAAGLDGTDPSVTAAIERLRATQFDDGGWGFDGVSNTSSTAFVVQALLAAGEDPEAATYTKGANTPVTFLLSKQQADGSFEGFDPLFATNQVTPALAGRTFCNMADTPVSRVREQQPTPTPTLAATATPSPTAATPSAPATGTGPVSGGSAAGPGVLAVVGLVLTFGGAAALRRR